MALQKDTETFIGITLTNAYLRIDEQSGGKDNINLRVRTYVSKEKREAGCTWIDEKIYAFIPLTTDDSMNFIKQGYEYLKTLPEYSDAVDC